MSHQSLAAPAPWNQPAHLAIVAARFNETYIEALLQSTVAELQRLAPLAKISIVRVGGSYDIPVILAKYLAKYPECDAAIALGVIFRGATSHAELIANSVTHALQHLALKHLCPILHEVLVFENEQQAQQRCIDHGDLNRGQEAARAAIELLHTIHTL